MYIHRWVMRAGVALCIGVCLVIVARAQQTTPAPPPVNAVAAPVVSLAGTWQFYWGALLTPADFAPAQVATLPARAQIPVPKTWTGYSLGDAVYAGRPLPRYGVATYRTHVQLPQRLVGVPSILLFESVGSAYRIWVNGALVGGLGQLAGSVSAQTSVEVPHIRLALYHIIPTTRDLDIVVQVSNHSFRESGIYGDVKLGPANATMAYVFAHYVVQDLLLIGLFVVVGLFHLITYVSSRRDHELLWLCGLCLCMAVRSLILNKYLLYLVTPELSWVSLMYFQYSIKFLTLLVFIQLIRVLYQQDVNPIVHAVCVVVCVMALVYVASVSPSISSLTIHLQTTGMVLVLGYYVYVVGYVAVVRSREGALLNTLGMVFVLGAIIHDYFLYVKSIDSVQLVPYGMLVILLVQAQIISYRYSRFQQRSMQLAYELQQANRSLEEKVIERTRELHASNVQLIELADQRSRLMANIAHDMGSPMSGVQSSLHIMGEHTLSPQTQKELVSLLITRVDHVKRLVDDLFQLAMLESRQWEFEWEQVPVAQVYAEMERYFAHMVHEQGRTLLTAHTQPPTIPADVLVRIDRGQIYRVVQNLLDNAIKYSPDPCQPIKLISTVRRAAHADTSSDEWCVEIVDFGVGIASEQLPMIFERFYTRSSGLPAGSGLGLAISKEIIERHGGIIDVRSDAGHGSTFCFSVPLVLR